MRLLSRAALLVLAFALPVLATQSGCALGRAAARSSAALFGSPQKVARVHPPVRPDARLAVIWVGHATVLVQIDDKVVLTDPVFTSTVGQVSKRLVEPGIDPDELPPVDAVLVSHMHFDHLSLGSLDMIEDRVRMLVLPRGGSAYVPDFRFPSVELRTWQPWEKDGLRVTAVPVDHVGFRYGLDEAWMKESFTGYVVEYHGIKVYFGGDSAYDQRMFVETGLRFPNLDLALVPIGPTEPREIMRRFHMDPGEAVQAFVDLGARRMVPIHYGTFINATDEPGDALRQLDAARKHWDLGQRQVAVAKIGERWVFMKQGEALPPPLPTQIAPSAPTPAAAPATDPSRGKTEEKKPDDDIPDDDRLD